MAKTLLDLIKGGNLNHELITDSHDQELCALVSLMACLVAHQVEGKPVKHPDVANMLNQVEEAFPAAEPIFEQFEVQYAFVREALRNQNK